MKFIALYNATSFKDKGTHCQYYLPVLMELNDFPAKMEKFLEFHGESYAGMTPIQLAEDNVYNLSVMCDLVNVPNYLQNIWTIHGDTDEYKSCSSTTLEAIIPFDDKIALNTLYRVSGEETKAFRSSLYFKPTIEDFYEFCEDMYSSSQMYLLMKSGAVTVNLNFDTVKAQITAIDFNQLPDGLDCKIANHPNIYLEYYCRNKVNSVNSKITGTTEYYISLLDFVSKEKNIVKIKPEFM